MTSRNAPIVQLVLATAVSAAAIVLAGATGSVWLGLVGGLPIVVLVLWVGMPSRPDSTRDAALRVLEAVPDAVLTTDPNGRVTSANREAVRLFSVETEEDLVGIQVDAMLEIEGGAGAADQYDEGGDPLSQVMPRLLPALAHRPNGRDFAAGVRMVPVTTSGRTAFVFTVRDLTQIQERERSLRESEERYRRLVELSPDMILVHSAGRVVFANRAAARILGLPGPREVIGQLVLDFVPPARRDEASRRMASVRGGSTPALIAEQRVLRPDGSEVYIEGTEVGTRFEGRDAVLLVARDVTERRKAAEERLRVQERMQTTQRIDSLGRLARGVAHDFNNLLVGIIGTAELAELELPSGPERERWEQVRSIAERAGELTRQMLVYGGDQHGELSRIDLSSMVRSMADLARSSVSRRAELVLELADALPAVRANEAELRQVLLNLLTNAGDALKGTGGHVAVRTGIVEVDEAFISTWWFDDDLTPGSYVFVEVDDDGQGIPEDLHQQVFEPFFTVDGGGRGLGLAAVLAIVRRHRGAVRVRSAPERGSTFTVLLPAEAAIVEQPQPRISHEAPPPPSSGKVLVVDDEEVVRITAAEVLRQSGYTVVEASDGNQALACLEAGGFTAALLDFTMPGIDGVEVLKRARALSPALPIVLTTGYDASSTLGEAVKLHGVELLQKPFRNKDLVTAVRRAIAMRSDGS